MPGEAGEVVDQIGHADLDPGALDADGSDEELHAMLFCSKDVLDGRAHGGSRRIGPGMVARQALVPGLFEVNH